jgi:hypothetical protein
MSVFQRVHMPSLDGATGWVKSDPLGPAELRGQVVLLELLDAEVGASRTWSRELPLRQGDAEAANEALGMPLARPEQVSAECVVRELASGASSVSER